MKKLLFTLTALFCLAYYAQAQTMKFCSELFGSITIELLSETKVFYSIDKQPNKLEAINLESGNLHLAFAGVIKFKVNGRLLEGKATQFIVSGNNETPQIALVIVTPNQRYIIDKDGLNIINDNALEHSMYYRCNVAEKEAPKAPDEEKK